MAVSPATPEYLKCSEAPITLDHNEHLDIMAKPGRYPIIVSHIIKDVKLNRVLIDGGSSLNIMFLKTFNQMGLSRSLLRPNRDPFHDIVTGAVATPIGQIILPVTFGTRENFLTKSILFEVTNFETAYNTFLGQQALSKFMAIPQYAYLVLKMPGQWSVISLRGRCQVGF
jgi:hypothetical protein